MSLDSRSHIPRFTSTEILHALQENPGFSFLFTENRYSFYYNEIKGAELSSLLEEYPDLLNLTSERVETEHYSVYSVNFISNSVQSNGSFHKIRVYVDSSGLVLQTLDSAKK